jgi:opacity protein-like surface antigen
LKKLLLLANASLSVVIVTHPALADGLYGNAPEAVFPPPFSWTSCYAGGHVGGAWATKDLRDPVQLVQDQLLGFPATAGVTTVATNPSGFIGGAQIGCDYQFAPNWVVGFEGTVSGSTLKGRATTALPLGNLGDQATVTASADFLPSLTARFGYAWDRWLFYAKGGAAWASDSYSVVGSFQGTPFNFKGLDEERFGWTVGGGAEWAIWRRWSIKLEYDYYDFGHGNVLMSDNTLALSAPINANQTVQTVRIGLNFHAW